MNHSIVRWLTVPDTWDFTDGIKPDTENPKKNRTASSFAISIWKEEPDTWEHDYVMSNKPPALHKINLSKVNIWAGEEGLVKISFEVTDEDGEDIQYKVLINNEEAIPLTNFYPTPAQIEASIPITKFNEKENLLELIVIDELGLETHFSYIIKKENRDTFIFKRIFDFKEDYITDENIEVIHGRGLTLKEIGRGEVNIEIPTEGKSKIEYIEIEDHFPVVSVVPIMSSNEQDGFIVSASSQRSSTYAPWKAFNGATNVLKDSWGASGTLPQWLQIELPESRIITKYGLVGTHTPTESPKSWTFEGSHDGENWDVLDEQIDIQEAIQGVEEIYKIRNSTAYKYYRLNITEKHRTSNYVYVGELKLYETLPTIQEELVINNPMVHEKDLGAGKVYESRLLTEYSDIGTVKSNQVEGRLFTEGDTELKLLSHNSPCSSENQVNVSNGYIYSEVKRKNSHAIFTKTPINLTHAKDIVVELDIYVSNTGVAGNAVIDICRNVDDETPLKRVEYSTQSFSRKVEYIDVSDIVGECYIVIRNIANTGLGYYRKIKIYNIFIMNKSGNIIYPKHLLKSNNKYYTYQNNEFIEVEPTIENFKENSVDLSQLTTPDENGIKPYKVLDNPSIVIYTEDEEVPILSQTVAAQTKARFLVSKDKNNFQAYRDNNWITIDKSSILNQGMTKTELESIPQEVWAEWFGNEAHKNTFDILVGMYSEEPNKPLIRSMTVNYAENESPIIIDAHIEPDTIHNEFATLKANVKDYEGDRISFKVLIKKAGTDEFVQVSPLEGWYNRSSSEEEITQAFNFPYFNPGENEIKLVVKDERGAEAEWVGKIILSNTDPIITITYDDFIMKATIGDDDGDDIAYRISVNGELIFDYTDFTPTKTFVNYVFAEHLKFGEENTIKLEVKDTHGGYASQEFTVIGTYRGLMFKNESGEYFVDNKGEVLMDLLFDKTLIGGQTSETKKVILENRHEFPLTNIKIEPENPNFVDGAVLEISETEMPFNPKSIIQILEIMPILGEKDFYVRVRTNRNAHQGGYFYIKSTASPIVK